MTTKENIKAKALELFNRLGVMNITLRDIAAALGRSYGNITYYYSTKEKLIEDLFKDMSEDYCNISQKFPDTNNLISIILELPRYVYDVTAKYLFFFIDYLEIRRNYPTLAKKIEEKNRERDIRYKEILFVLRSQGYIRKEMDDASLDYLAELSGTSRIYFFINLKIRDVSGSSLKPAYIDYVNRALLPYLAKKGLNYFNQINPSLCK